MHWEAKNFMRLFFFANNFLLASVSPCHVFDNLSVQLFTFPSHFSPPKSSADVVIGLGDLKARMQTGRSSGEGQLWWINTYVKFMNFPQSVVIYTVKGFGIVNKAEIDVFLTLSCFFDDPADVGNLISGSNQEIFFASEQVLKEQPSLARHSCFIAPDVTGLPTIPENLTACLHGSVALLYPMYWQHIYIPVLPPHLLDYCCAPMPYLIGIHSSLLERVKNKSLEDVVMLNVDTNTLESPFNDLSSLPSDVVSALKNKLKKQSTATGDGVARAFLRAQAALFGSYRDALRYKPGEPITFCEESFVKHRSSVMKQFLETAVNLQLFKQVRVHLHVLFWNSKSYQQWVHTVKKGGALFNTAMTKASPAVRTAYKFAKNHAKQGIKEVKSKLRHKENEDDFGTCSGSVQYTPIYTLHGERGGNLARRKISQVRGFTLLLSSEDGEEASAYFYESDDSLETRAKAPSPGEMDLLGEILDTLSTHSSDQGKLAAARSLDFFRSMDEIDYKPTNKSNAPSESDLALLCSGSGDQAGWHRGQDDSALLGRQLPPSPRKRLSSGAGTDPLFILEEEAAERPLGVGAESRAPAQGQPGPAPGAGAPPTERKETLSPTAGDGAEASLARRLSTCVPWERGGKAAPETAAGPGLLQEVASLCHITSAFQQDLHISGGPASGHQA
ncbi:hypothetical protein FD754_020793 [Muntiacus muntjak]|uniref:UDENN domain-containing protein n=1 Tax=Muntiacus muntjak TaxID=9888 RepID=A0A5N3V3Y6_MUNMU|nr:hypothetical protein FD754_020793 [Muntiacus muntjak]